MPIALLITETDAEGRPTGILIPRGEGAAAGADQRPLPVMPELVRFADGDRAAVRQPVKDPSLRLPDMQPGDVVVAEEAIGWPDAPDRNAVYLVNSASVIGRASTVEAAESLFAAHAPSAEPGSMHTIEQIAFEADAERAANEPHEALVVAWLGRNSSIETHVLRHKGSYCFWAARDGAADCCAIAMNVPEGPGMWLLTDGEVWSSRDWESGVTDDWGLCGEYTEMSLELAAAYAGVSADELRAEIDQEYPYILSCDILEALHYPEGVPNDASVTAP